MTTTDRTFQVTAYNAEGQPLSLRPHHVTDREAFYAEGHEVGPFTAGDALAYVREAGRTGVRVDDDYNQLIQPVAEYRVWHNYAPGHYEVYEAPRISAHSTCLHDRTKAARAACRRGVTA